MYGTTCFYPGQALTSVSINIIPLRTSGFFGLPGEDTVAKTLLQAHQGVQGQAPGRAPFFAQAQGLGRGPKSVECSAPRSFD